MLPVTDLQLKSQQPG